MNIKVQLEELVGFAVPAQFVTIVKHFVSHAGDFERGRSLLRDYLGAWVSDTTKCRYESTPVEFVPFLDSGGDGEMYGYVLHAPELESSDYPMAAFAPLDDGLIHIGNSTRDAIENMISYRHANSDSQEIDHEFLKGLEIFPSVKKASEFRKLDGESYIRPSPAARSGWRHVMTGDGVGVFAEERVFLPGGEPQLAYDAPIAQYMRQAEEAMFDGFAASALVTLKDAWWYKFNSGEPLNALRLRLAECYLALGKSKLQERLLSCFVWDLDEMVEWKLKMWPRNIKIVKPENGD